MRHSEGELKHPINTKLLITKIGQAQRDAQLNKENLKLQRRETALLRQKMHALRQETENLKQKAKANDELRMQLFRANLSVKFVEKIVKKEKYVTKSNENANTHSTTRMVRLAAIIKKDAFMKITKLSTKYYTVLLNLEQVNPHQRLSKKKKKS